VLFRHDLYSIKDDADIWDETIAQEAFAGQWTIDRVVNTGNVLERESGKTKIDKVGDGNTAIQEGEERNKKRHGKQCARKSAGRDASKGTGSRDPDLEYSPER
jgi:hypothetical protein